MPTLEEEKTLKDAVATKYRRAPRVGALGSRSSDYGDPWEAREKRCERSNGHVLAFRKGKIVCTNCTAEWVDHGC